MSGSTQPSTVINQTGRLLKSVNWVSAAWVDIQSMHEDWQWMQGEFTGTLGAGSARYTAASFSLSRWLSWVTVEEALSMYDTTIGVSDEKPLTLMSWENWRRTYDRGAQANDRPLYYTVSPAGELCFGPAPALSTYRIKGEYRKNPQVLAANADVPEFADHHHMLIVWQALLTLDEHDDASIAKAQRRRQDLMRVLERQQLPEVKIGGGPLA